MKNLNKEIKGIENRTLMGLIDGVYIIRRAVDLESPKVPVGETGNLRASWSTVTSKGMVAGDSGTAFTGDDASQMTSQHASVVEENKAAAARSKNPIAIFGFSALYAAPVHENYGAHFKRPGAGAGYLVSAINSHEKDIFETIRENAKVKK